MNHVRNILAIVDPTSDRHTAVAKAAALATAFDAHLHLFICDTPLARETRMVRGVARRPEQPLTINLKPLLEELARPLREDGLDVTTDTAFAEQLYVGLLERIRNVQPDIVVKDTHHHSLAARAFLTNTDWHLIRDCASPLLLVKETPWTDHPTFLAAVDPEHVNDKPAVLDQHILEWSTALSQRTSGTLHVAHAYIPLIIATTAASGTPPVGSVVTPELLAEEERTKHKQLQALTQRFGVNPSNIHLALGTATDVLPRFAQDLHAHVVVMGAVSRRGLKRVFVGNTAERVLERLPCDVLVIKSPQFGTP